MSGPIVSQRCEKGPFDPARMTSFGSWMVLRRGRRSPRCARARNPGSAAGPAPRRTPRRRGPARRRRRAGCVSSAGCASELEIQERRDVRREEQRLHRQREAAGQGPVAGPVGHPVDVRQRQHDQPAQQQAGGDLREAQGAGVAEEGQHGDRIGDQRRAWERRRRSSAAGRCRCRPAMPRKHRQACSRAMRRGTAPRRERPQAGSATWPSSGG